VWEREREREKEKKRALKKEREVDKFLLFLLRLLLNKHS